MPVIKKNNLYEENPKQSQAGASGFSTVPHSTFHFPAGSSEPETSGGRIFIPDVPALGYNYELTNIFIPLTVSSEINESVVKMSMRVNVGAKLLYIVTKEVTTAKTGVNRVNIVLSESPLIPAIITSGQQLSLEFKGLCYKAEKETLWTLGVARENSNENSETVLAPGTINYRYI